MKKLHSLQGKLAKQYPLVGLRLVQIGHHDEPHWKFTTRVPDPCSPLGHCLSFGNWSAAEAALLCPVSLEAGLTEWLRRDVLPHLDGRWQPFHVLVAPEDVPLTEHVLEQLGAGFVLNDRGKFAFCLRRFGLDELKFGLPWAVEVEKTEEK
jgi:hypothetical protein